MQEDFAQTVAEKVVRMLREQQIVNNVSAEFYTSQELAVLLNVNQKWVQNNTQKMLIPGQTKVGKHWRYRKQDVDKKLLSGSLLLEEV